MAGEGRWTFHARLKKKRMQPVDMVRRLRDNSLLAAICRNGLEKKGKKRLNMAENSHMEKQEDFYLEGSQDT